MTSSGSLLVLHDADDLACAEAGCPEALLGDVLSFDTDIHLLLQDRGLAHLTPWDIVQPGEGPRLKAYDAAIRHHWTTHARLEFDGLNLLNMAAYRHISAFARLAWAAYALRRALEHVRPATVFVFDEPPAHGLDQPVAYRKMPLLFGLLRWLAEQAGLSVRLISRDVVPDLVPFEDQVAKRNRRIYPPADAEAALEGRPFVLFHANRTDLLRQLPLIHAYREQTGGRVVQLYAEADCDIVRRVEQDGHFVWHESQVAPCDTPPDIESSARAARHEFDAASRVASDELRALFDNSHVASHLDFLFGEYAGKMAEHVLAWKRFFARCRPAAFVANSHAPIYDVAAAVGIRCLGLSHALMMIGQPRWFDSLPAASLIGALSERHRDRLVEAGVRPGRIRVTGDPHSDRLLGEVRDRQDRAAASLNLRRRLGIAADRRIVLLCTGSFGMPSNTTHLPLTNWADGVRCMEELGEVVRRRGEWAFVVKCHPRFDHPALYAAVNRTLPPDRRLIVLPNEPLVPLVEAADAVCVWCAVTSALVEASLVGKPVMQFARSLIWYDPDEWGCQTWPHFWDLNAFETELETLFSDTDHYARRVDQTRRAVRRFLGDTADGSIQRCLRVLGEFASTTAEPAEARMT